MEDTIGTAAGPPGGSVFFYYIRCMETYEEILAMMRIKETKYQPGYRYMTPDPGHGFGAEYWELLEWVDVGDGNFRWKVQLTTHGSPVGTLTAEVWTDDFWIDKGTPIISEHYYVPSRALSYEEMRALYEAGRNFPL